MPSPSPYSTELIAATLRSVIEARRRERPGDRDLSASALAASADVVYSTFYRYLNGTRSIPAPVLYALLHHLGSTPEHFGRLLTKAGDPEATQPPPGESRQETLELRAEMEALRNDVKRQLEQLRRRLDRA